MDVRTLLLDIEGTTTPIDFVYKVLFPYARAHAREFLASRLDSEELKAEIAAFRRENSKDKLQGLDPPSLADPPEPDSLVAYVHWLMDRDHKSTPLKALQGKIWEEGYQRGELRGLVFEDVPRAFERWRLGRLLKALAIEHLAIDAAIDFVINILDARARQVA